jgi:RNA polymerase sigma-70 factor (ECF subfamily)
VLKHTLIGTKTSGSHADLARQLGMNEGAVKVAIHRLRQRYRQLLEDEIAQTVHRTQDIAAERRHLLEALTDS